MRKQELQDLNAELVDLLGSLREQIDDKLDELAAIEEIEDGEDESADDEADDETGED